MTPISRRFTARGGKLIVLPRLAGPGDPGGEHRQLLRLRRHEAGPAGDRRVRAPLHGARRAALRDGPGPDAFGQAGDWSSDDPSRSLRAALVEWVEKGDGARRRHRDEVRRGRRRTAGR